VRQIWRPPRERLPLLVVADSPIWGVVDPISSAVDVHANQQPGDEDPSDLAAVQTVCRGGQVHVLASHEAPAASPVSAIYRY